MAEIRKIVRSTPLSAFTQVAPAAGGAFAVLADVANQAYQMLEPVADAQMAQRSEEENRQLARQQVGANTIPVAPPAPSGPDLSTIAPVPEGFSVEGARAAIDRADAQMTGGGGAPAVAGGVGSDRLGSALPASLVRTESGGNLSALNSEGYGGRGQFGAERLAEAFRAGVIDRPMTGAEFSRQPESVQAAVERWHVGDINSFIQQRGLDRFVGRTIKGVEVTPNGMIAVAHLGGKGGLQKFLESGGSYNPADSNGTSLLGYLRTHQGATITGSAGTPVMAGGGSADTLAPPPTMVRTSQGKLEPRLYNPAGGRFAQIYNAVAKMTFLSESMLAGQADMMNLSAQMPMDPDGFKQQARAYIDQTVANADPMLRPDLRANLETEMQRRYLGMVDERNDDIRRRAENAQSALVDRYSSTYVDALAAGNIPEAQSARAQLEDALYAYESLPGASWTREQSVNVLLQAERQSRRVQADRATAQTAEWKDGFETSIAARKDGMIGAAEYLLDNPAAVAAHPDLAEELAAWTEFQTAMPGFRTLPPPQQRAAVAEMRNVPVSDRYQITMAEKAQEVAAASEKAWADDGMAYAEQLSRVSDFPPPPALPAFDPANPSGFVAALQARRDYGLNLQAQGYTQGPTFLKNEEAGVIASQIEGMNAEGKTIIAGAIASALGPSGAPAVFAQIGQDEPTFKLAGMMLAASPDLAPVAYKIIRGQELIDTNMVEVPTRLPMNADIAVVTEAMMATNPRATQAMVAELHSAARAYLAGSGGGANPALFGAAWQAALGQTTKANVTYGGVQDVMGMPMLLPPTFSAEQVETALAKATGQSRGWMMRSMMSAGIIAPDPGAEGMADGAVWQSVAGSMPYAAGQPMTAEDFASHRVTLVPLGRMENGHYAYNMVAEAGIGKVDVTDATGARLRIDLNALIEATQ